MVALAPLWLLGIFGRGLWTPDEPREADIAWRMTQQSDRSLPQLADIPFLEKPPLSYWMSAATLSVFGDSPAALRAPNLLYALISALAVAVLALVVIALGAYVLSHNSRYLSDYNINSVMFACAALGFISLGQTFALLLGGIDLSVGANLALATVLGGLVFRLTDSAPLVMLTMLVAVRPLARKPRAQPITPPIRAINIASRKNDTSTCQRA